MDKEILQKYISNPERNENTPDEVTFGDETYTFADKNTYPFSYVQMPGTKEYQLLFGEPGTSHGRIRDRIINTYRKQYNNFTKLDRLFGGYMRKEYVEQMKRPKANAEECIERAIKFGGKEYLGDHEQNGRCFFISEDDTNICIFSFWNVYRFGDDDEDYLEPDSQDIGRLVKMVMEKDQRIGQCDLILIANNSEPYYVYKEDVPDDFFKIGDNTDRFIPHLADQDKKREFFADFRTTRDNKIAKKLTSPETGKEMPLAQYNALRYVDESKIGPRRIFVTESQLNEYLKEGNKKQYSWNDKLELVRDKNIVDGGNFPIKRNGKEYWISRSTTVGVYVFCLDQTGVIYTLASKRGPHVHTQQNLWNAPCGYLEYGDSIKETAVKECWEETGVKIPFEKLVYLGENSEFSRNSDVKHTFYCVLDGLITDYPPSIANCEPGEVTDARWIELDELNNYHFVGQQAKRLYNIGFKLFKRVGLYKTNKDYATIIQSLQNMLSNGIIDDDQIARIKDVLNI